jgi:hypothetical protein
MEASWLMAMLEGIRWIRQHLETDGI